MGVEPVAFWSRQGTQITAHEKPPRRGKASAFAAKPEFDPRAALVKFYPSMQRVTWARFSAQGCGAWSSREPDWDTSTPRTSSWWKKFIGDGGVVCMTSQCLWGRVDMNVYDTGRDLQKAGWSRSKTCSLRQPREADVVAREHKVGGGDKAGHAREPRGRGHDPDDPKKVVSDWQDQPPARRYRSTLSPASSGSGSRSTSSLRPAPSSSAPVPS